MKFLHLVAIVCLISGAMTGVCHARTKVGTTFILHEISFSPTKLFSKQQLNELSSPYLNKKISKSDLNQLTKNLTHIYQQNGYLLSRAKIDFISPTKHNARIQLIEMKIDIDDKKIEPYAAQNIISSFKSNSVFSVPQSQKTLLLLNEIPGLSAKATVKPNQQKDAFNFDIDTKQESYKARYRIDTYGSAENDHTLRLISEVESYHLLPFLELIGARGAEYMGDDTVRYGEIFTESWLGSDGIRWKNRLGKIDSSSPQADLGFIATGQSNFFETSLFVPLKRTPHTQSSTSLSWRHLKSESSIFDLNFFKDEVDVVSWSWQNLISGNQQISNTNITINKGIDAISGTSDDQFLSRPDGDLNFTKINIDHEYAKFVGDKGYQLILSTEVQYSFDPLVASEEFVAGGPNIGRAFPFASITGDDGMAFSLELAQPQYDIVLQNFSTQLYGFIDGAIARQKKTNMQKENFDAISSMGVGVRATLYQTTNIQFEISNPIYRNGITAREHDSPRLSLTLTGEF
jgi:hemolysin activation/secretion protein